MVESKKNIHELGVNYINDLLERVGFTIHEVNVDPDHHFQIYAQFKERALLIAVRTAYHPGAGTIDETMRQRLVEEARQLKAVPHFAGLSLTTSAANDSQLDNIDEEGTYEIFFSGMIAVR
ncbi:MAG: hypothetical protein KJP19_09530 [Deltaproteobacteria bacterium]|nr:hypothetical protein [Deltaproteobacteria bacterium]NNF47621.1 hypothetical protein [Desulfofustis sp.]NNK58609.1 hypothetical protein [Desulfofustis sp.]